MEADILNTMLDEEGYLIDPAQWNESVAQELAKRADITLEEEHWDVIRFMREYYAEHGIIADARHAIKHLSAHCDSDARNRLFELFPYGYVGQACRIAGMKRPRGWSTG